MGVGIRKGIGQHAGGRGIPNKTTKKMVGPTYPAPGRKNRRKKKKN